MRQRFGKKERLKSPKTIEKLFAEGNRLTVFPLRIYYLSRGEKDCHQAAFSVPKRRFRKAVERNRIKRKMREAYRLNKQLLEGKTPVYAFLIVYIAKEEVAFSRMEKALQELFKSI